MSEIARPGQGCFRRKSDASIKRLRESIEVEVNSTCQCIHAKKIACYRSCPVTVYPFWQHSCLASRRRKPVNESQQCPFVGGCTHTGLDSETSWVGGTMLRFSRESRREAAASEM